MKLVPVVLTEEILGDTCEFCINANGQLDLDSGDITIKKYYIENKDEDENVISTTPYDVVKNGLPALHKEYDFTSGLLKIGTKELEFAVIVNKETGEYEVNVHELEEIKEKAANLISDKPATKKKKS